MVVVALAVGSAAAAQESNSLQAITPVNGANLDTSPATIVLSFDQELRSSDRPLVFLACGNEPQDLGSPEVDPQGLVVTFEVLTPVPRGACTITWRLADADNNSLLGPEFTTFRVDSDPPPPPAPPRRRRRGRPRPRRRSRC